MKKNKKECRNFVKATSIDHPQQVRGQPECMMRAIRPSTTRKARKVVSLWKIEPKKH